MIDTDLQLKYISDKLSFLASKVEMDNSQGLYNINKVSESIFLHLLNCSFNYSLEDANRVLYSDFPAIDLIDHSNKLVIQVTSTLTTQKIYNSISKLQDLNEISSYSLKMCYISRKPNFSKQELLNIKKRGLTESDLLGIDDILEIATSDLDKRKDIYNTLFQRLDSKAFNLDIEDHFNKFESQLNTETTNKFYTYNDDFETFIQSDANVLEVYAVGGNGKSHLLKHFASLKGDYTPVLFTKQTNVETDLKHLDLTQNYLFIYDDIDRFLDESINSIFSFIIDSGSKIVISYRAASKPLIEERISKFSALKIQEISITWNKDEIKDLILLISPNATEHGIKNINAQFNSNPYLITQALKGGIEEIKSFSKKTLNDAITALKKFEIKAIEIEKLLFRIALLSPCPKDLINSSDKDKIDELLKVGILRELNNKIRFNPDILGDLYLTDFIKKYENKHKEITAEYIEKNLELIVTNLSYAVGYEDNDSLKQFFQDLIKGWSKDKDYRSSNLQILYRIVDYAPFESFIYLKDITETLDFKENAHQKLGFFSEFIPQICEVDFNTDDNYINLGSIVPIINILISYLKNEKNVGRLEIKHIIDFLVSPKVLSSQEPHFANHNIVTVFKDMIIPFESKSNNVIIEALDQMAKWLDSGTINSDKVAILKNSLSNLLTGTIKYMYNSNQTRVEFDTTKENISKVLNKAKEIVIIMLTNTDINLKCMALDILTDIGHSIDNELKDENEQYYYKIVLEIFAIIDKQINIIKDYNFLSKLDEVLLKTMAFRKHRDEAFELFIKIPRTPIFTFNQLLIGKTHIVYNLDEFIEEYPKQEDVKEWIFDKHYNKYNLDTSKDDMGLYNYFIKTYATAENFINFINSLYLIEDTKSYELTKLLEYWHEQEPKLISDLSTYGLSKIENKDVLNIIEDFILTKSFINVAVDRIDETVEFNDFRRYTEISFRRNDLSLYEKLLTIIQKEKKENILEFINTSFFHMFRLIKNDTNFITYKPYIHELLNLMIEYRFTPSTYLIFILEYLGENNIPHETIKTQIAQIIYIPSSKENLEEIKINDNDLKKIFYFLDYRLEDILARIFLKIFTRGIFNNYNKSHKIEECFLIQDYIKDYQDYIKLVELALYYYDNFTYTYTDEDGLSSDHKIDMEYFFKGLKKEYLERYIQVLMINENKKELTILIEAIPIIPNYKELLVEVLNCLDTELSNEKIIDLLSKNRIHKAVYEELLNDKTLYTSRPFAFEVINEEISNQEELLTYVSQNISNINILSEIEEILTEIRETKKIVQEINIEQTIK